MQASLQLQCRVGSQRPQASGLRTSLRPTKVFMARSAVRGLRLPARHSVAVKAQMFDGFENLISKAAHSAADPSAFDHIAAALTTSLFFADIDPSAATDAVDAAADAASKKGGFFSFFTDSFESFIKLIDDGLAKAGVPYSYGFAIILITIAVKLATYPLSKKQVESTLSMQALQPRIKDLQAKFANDPERLQVETAKMYQTAGVNPLAGCLPTLATIPVFIGLYRALSNVADEGLLTEGFFWIPSLAGPTKLNGGLGWLSLTDGGAPPLGWHDTISYLILPVLLVVSQFFSQKIISPQQQSTDPAQQQTQNILKFIPLMIGWFSLNVPSGLTLYWFTNNIITTAQQVYLRKKFQPAEFPTGGGGGTIVKPKAPEMPRGPTGKDLNARRSNKSSAVIDVEAETVSDSNFPAAPFGGASSSSSAPSSSSLSSGQSQGEKFRAIKAREAARKAAEQAGVAPSASSDGNGAGAAASTASAPVATAVDDKASKPQVPSAAPAKDGGFAKSNGARGKSSGSAKKGSKKK